MLVGTQMVAKGHDFPDVVLSVVLDADATLRFPDFRAEERTFALVAQLAGRSGRGERGGRVLVQTLAPEARGDPPRRGATTRRDSWPASSSGAGRCATRRSRTWSESSSLRPRPSAAQAAASGVREAARGRAPRRAPSCSGPAPRFRLRGRHRRQLLLKACDRAATWPRSARRSRGLRGRGLRGVSVSVDVDPQ